MASSIITPLELVNTPGRSSESFSGKLRILRQPITHSPLMPISGTADRSSPLMSNAPFDRFVAGQAMSSAGCARDGNFCSQTIPVGLWRTKGLRQVAKTAPYFRDGQAATLADVIDFYDRGGDPDGTFLGGPKEIRPLHLSKEEKEWLKEFLKTLTGEPVPGRYLQDLHNP
jgi:hypothetical protein